LHGSLKTPVRVRFAPSPTGYLHIGNARTALFNWLIARKEGGAFVLRIEDTDPARSRPEFTRALMDDLRWLGLQWDEGPDVGGLYGPYFQSLRKHLYQSQIDRLFDANRAFYCFCPPGEAPKIDWICRELSPSRVRERLARGEPAVIRFRVPEDAPPVTFTDLLKGELRFEPKEIGDFSLMRSDGMPLYNLSCVVDDHAMDISLVIRGDDHLSNTPKQILLYQFFGYEPPQFIHLPLILGNDGTPLSKRHGDTSVAAYRSNGFLPQALVNFLALLGWNPGTEEEFLPPDRLLELFRLDQLNVAPAKFNLQRLLWLNGKFIRAMDVEDLARHFWRELQNAGFSDASYELVRRITPLFQERVETLKDIVVKARFFFVDPWPIEESLTKKYLSDARLPEIFRQILHILESGEDLNPVRIEPVVKQCIQEGGFKLKEVLQPLRVILTGMDASPGIFETMEALGKEKVISRLRRFLSSA
jgi:glutamyl-tRNA synthetase